LGIVWAADEAVVLWQFYVAGFVSLGARWHGGILTLDAGSESQKPHFSQRTREMGYPAGF
jgi:hypothetical protein